MKKETITRLSDSSFIRKKRLRSLFPSDRQGWRRCKALAILLLVEIVLVFTSQRLKQEPACYYVQHAPEIEPVVENTALTQTPSAEGKMPPAEQNSPLVEPEELIVDVPPDYEQTIEVTLKRGDTLFDILMKEGIQPGRIHGLVECARPVHDLGKLRQGMKFTLVYDNRDGRILHFETALDGDHLLIVESQGDTLAARKEAFDFETRHRTVLGTIDDSLFMSANDAGLPLLLTLSLAEIFAWDIDFNVDIREGDSFKVLFEEKHLDGSFARYGRILAAEITNRGRAFWAIYFEGSDGRTDYFDRDGRSLQKLFLKSPLKYTRISSRFTQRRLHPILKIYRPHLGVDYAAPTGTPVHAIGDGRVTFAGSKGGFGRYVEIRHNGVYTSSYGHLHRYAQGIRAGRYVRQGQVIGYVGSSGLATGPHLDFRLLKNGCFINPLTVNYPNADPVGQPDRVAFKQVVERMVAKIGTEGPVLSRLTDGPGP